MESGMRRQAWNGIADLIFCAILVVLAFLAMMRPFMQLNPNEPFKYTSSIRDGYDDDNVEDDLSHKLKATMGGLVLTVLFSAITALLTILGYMCPYDKMRCPLNFFPYLFFISSIITIVASVLVYVDAADARDDLPNSEIKPYIGFVCCLLSGVVAIMFLCVRGCYKPVPKDNHSSNSQPLNNYHQQDNQHSRV